MFGIVAVFAQLRVDTIRENTRAGLARARSMAAMVAKKSPTALGAFKRAVLPTLTRLGAPVAFFDNEPANCNAARELLPDADVIWLDTQCVPNPPPLDEGIPMVRHFEGFR